MVSLSHLFNLSHSSRSLSLRRLPHDNFDYCPRYSQNHFYSSDSLSRSTRSASIMAGRRSNDGTMNVAVIYEAGGPEVFKLEKRPIPKPVGDQGSYKMQLKILTS